ncbi:MlaC/ttg2D family ABC transporter substrate-binding protein [Indioceanicola profundi]|uniref:MlaC/ttg2D family ABC transporter substrate-binding protein n=1 Tax=Indioceanicola profundi TaxID=2220096 RepID=UPI000E6AA9BE|nr:ABC transporter substrate-binding protein [Indioceanicola profundi]
MNTRRNFLRGALGTIVAGFVAFAGPAWAQTETKAASEFVQGLGDRVISTLADRSVGEAERKQVFRDLLTENFDVQTIGRFVLGPHWRNATPEQQSEYMDLFQRMIVEVYAQRFSEYSGEQFKVTGAQPAGSRDAVVTSQVLRPNGPPVNVAWRVRGRDDSFKIVDVIVENVSMSQTQRSEFSSVIDNNGGRFDALLNALRQRIQTADGK